MLLHTYFRCAQTLLPCAACVEKSQRGKLVNWVEKANFEKIQKLLEIFERERHHEVLLTLKNLGDLSHNPAPYSVAVIPRPLPTKLWKGALRYCGPFKLTPKQLISSQGIEG